MEFSKACSAYSRMKNLPYFYGNNSKNERRRLELLGEAHDAASIALCNRAREMVTVRKVLEIGPGSGSLIVKLCSLWPGVHFRALDIEVTYLHASLRSVVTVGTIESAPFSDNEFDLCHARLVLSHVTDLQGSLAELHRITKPNGVVIVEELDHQRPQVFESKVMVSYRKALAAHAKGFSYDRYLGSNLVEAVSENGKFRTIYSESREIVCTSPEHPICQIHLMSVDTNGFELTNRGLLSTKELVAVKNELLKTSDKHPLVSSPMIGVIFRRI